MKTFKYLITALALALFSPLAATAEESYVMVGGVSGLESTQYATFQAAYEAIKPKIEAIAGLGQDAAEQTKFDALFTDRAENGDATLTYKISGNVVYDETSLANLLSMGRKSSHFGNGRHLINFKFVGVTGRKADTLTVNSGITLPYEWWGEKTTTGIHFENLTIASTNGKSLNPSQAYFEGIDFSVDNCTVKVGISSYVNCAGSYSITDSTLDGTDSSSNYAMQFQGSNTESLAITIKGNEISGFARGVNIDQKTAVADIEDNEISVTDPNRSCIQLSGLAKADIKENTFDLNGGNALTLHENLAKLSTAAEVAISANKVEGTGYLIYDAAQAEGTALTSSTITLTIEGNSIAKTVDTTQGKSKNGTTSAMSEVVKTVVEANVAIAKIGETEYTSLADAFAAAQSGDTVTLVADLTEVDAAESGIVYNMAGVTFDLNGKTYSHYNFSHVFQGTGGVIKNGKMVCLNGGSYALFIGDMGDTTSFTVENVEMTGGINVFNATGVVLKDLNVVGQDYYAVWADEGAVAIIESGTYSSAKASKGEALLNANPYSYGLEILGGTFKANGNNLMGNAGGTLEVSGGTFDTKVAQKYCAPGYQPKDNGSGVYGVADAIQVLNSNGNVAGTYHSFAKASAAATSGQTIKLLADVANTDYTVANVIDIKLAKGVTLDGNDKTLSGNIKVTVAPEGGVTITNVKFKDIHNLQALSEVQKSYYKFSDTKVGTLSAVYAKNLKGKLSVSGCVFENCDWEALQIVPVEGAEIDICENSFKSTASTVVTEQLRHVHVQMTGASVGTAITLTMTDNQLYGEPLDSSCGVYSMSSKSTLDLTGNYFEKPNTASITLTDIGSDGESVDVNRCELIYPARKEATVDTDDLKAVAVVEKDIYLVTAYDSLAAAIAAATEGQTVKLIANTDENVTIGKNLTLDLNGHTLNGGTVKATPTLTVKANVTILDSTEDKKGTIKREDTADNSDGTARTSHYVIDIQGKDAYLTFESGNVVNNSGTIPPAARQGASLVRVGDDAKDKRDAKPTLVIKGGTFTQDNFPVIKVDYGTFYLQGGEINCAIDEAIKNWATTYIQGGTVTGTVASWVYGKGIDSSTLEISGGKINGNVYSMTQDGAEGKTSVVSITDGTVTGNLGTYQGKNIRDTEMKPVTDTSKTTIAVSGGTFSNEVAQKYCAEGYYPVKNADGLYVLDIKTEGFACEVTSATTVKIVGLGDISGSIGNLEIPEMIGGRYVTEIADRAFVGTSGITSLTLSKYCKKIGNSAFRNITSLTKITFAEVYEIDGTTPAALEIGEYAFNSASISELDVPEYVSSIAQCAFSSCTNLKKVRIASSATTVAEGAFHRSGVTLGKKPSVLTFGSFSVDGSTATMKVVGTGGVLDVASILSKLKVLYYTALNEDPTEITLTSENVGTIETTTTGFEVNITIEVPTGTTGFFRVKLED